ncbi:Uncharacterized protein C8034_v001252 [Colletotrichum sidae]|uniref:Uncharacterized protein n=4 Tax=Colletotrichum orbiculare species complex TaxID=2707354 RepID=N4VKH3_COLOR|nr:Uncharacterized protein Cob_v003947 [Colletotrichum orbiculare MAFF 240422]TDZ34760.1 Uncharacterized protein C8035_v002621 [Colletotrichum spinosum]TDZ65977.1 Uncharacterized protein CTRI78_v003296 [Colletotrichum trifolii]TEA22739.1 Uncharacterized protein C8034_v001252 [Colletotrichum sidae]
MRPFALLLAAFTVVPSVFAVDQMKSVIIWAPDDSTPDSVIAKAREAIVAANGKITHDYSLIRGFAAITGAKVLESVQTFSDGLKIDDDQQVTSG